MPYKDSKKKKEYNKKYSNIGKICIDCSREITIGSKLGRCDSCSKLGELSPLWKGGLPRCITCEKELGNYCSKQCKRCSKLGKKRPDQSERMKGKNNPNFGKPPIHGKRIKYNGELFRSSWECNFVKWCDKNNIKWQYESKSFNLGNCSYIPDFYLPEFNLYIEIKGWWRDKAKDKFKLFKQIYCGTRIKLIEKQELKQYKII